MIILPFVFTVVGSNDIAQLVKVSGYNVTVAVPGTFDEISLPISIWNEAVVKAGLGFRILLMIIFMDLTASFEIEIGNDISSNVPGTATVTL